jgi:hypothetical protein
MFSGQTRYGHMQHLFSGGPVSPRPSNQLITLGACRS